MAKYSQAARFKEAVGSVSVDPRVMDILQTAAAAYGLDVQFTSGVADRSAGTHNHDHGYAVDIQLFDGANPLPNYQNGAAFADYEKFAQTARVVQQQKYPELDNTFRWGGYFSHNGGAKGYGAVDLMHFDINPKMKGAMGLGSWNGGAGAALIKAYPGATTNGGLSKVGPQLRAAVAGVPVPPAEIPGAPMPMPGRPPALSLPPAPPVPMPGRPAALGGSAATVAPVPMPGRPAALGGAPAPAFNLAPPDLPLNAPLPAGTGRYYGPNTDHWGPQFTPAPPIERPAVRAISVNPDGTEVIPSKSPDLLSQLAARAASKAKLPTRQEADALAAVPKSARGPVLADHVQTAPESSNIEDTRAQSPSDKLIDAGQAYAGHPGKPDLVEQLAARAAVKTASTRRPEDDPMVSAMPKPDAAPFKPVLTTHQTGQTAAQQAVIDGGAAALQPTISPAWAKWDTQFGSGAPKASVVAPNQKTMDLHDSRDDVAASAAALKSIPAAPSKWITPAPVATKAPAKDAAGSVDGAKQVLGVLGNVLNFAKTKAADLGSAVKSTAAAVAKSAPAIAANAKDAVISNLMSTVAGRSAVLDPMMQSLMTDKPQNYGAGSSGTVSGNMKAGDTFQGTSNSGKTYTVGQQYQNSRGQIVTARPDGSFS